MKQTKGAAIRSVPSTSIPDVCRARRFTRRNPPGSFVRQKSPTLPKDVPILVKEKEEHGYGSSSVEETIRLALKAERTLLGPMPVDQFLQIFLPLPSTKNTPDSSGIFDGILTPSCSLHELCAGLAEALERSGCCPNVKFASSTPAQRDSKQYRSEPEIIGYAKDDVKLNKDGGRFTLNVGFAEICIQVRLHNDPFYDNRGHGTQSDGELETSFLTYRNHGCHWRCDTHARREVRAFGRMVAQASEVCARQHRVFLFSMMIVGTRARFFRWDRAGIIVTESFDYVENPKLLCEFLWRFNHASPVQRGYDPTVVVASAKEERLFRDNIAKEVAFQLGIKRSNEKFAEAVKRHYEAGKVTKVKVFDNSEWIECLISVPVTSPRPVIGCGTRGYWAVILTGPSKGKVVFLKDIWRLDASADMLEGEIYDEMMKADVTNISNKLLDGDVLYEEDSDVLTGSGSRSAQLTRSQEFINESWNNGYLEYNKGDEANDRRLRVFRHTHYRMILEDVGYPLSEFTGSRELFEATRDAVHALISAYEKCSRLHRDVSINNIILVRRRGFQRRKGVLIDWELSVKADTNGCSTDHTRSGTWAFMSADALKASDHEYQHTRGDDFESVLYVLVFASAHWLAHSYGSGLGAWIHKFFDDCDAIQGEQIGGDRKSRYILYGNLHRDFRFPTPGIGTFFSKMYGNVQTKDERLRTINIPSTWTADNVIKHFDNVCKALAGVPGTDQDRVIHDTDYYRESGRFWPSQTSFGLDSDATPSTVGDGSADDLPRCGRKRAFREGDDDELDVSRGNDTAGEPKRGRIEKVSNDTFGG